MNRIDETFARLKPSGEKALVGFVTAGDPDLETSLQIVEAMCREGLDLLELGVAFSDPTADGPVIQRSSARALAAGTTLEKVLEMTERIRSFTEIPIVLFSYYNPIHRMGAERFHRRARAAGADALLVVDLPPEESEELSACGAENPLPVIRLVAPTTPDERVAAIAARATGFLYLVSKTGVTGSDGLDPAGIAADVGRVHSASSLPVCVGFGIRSAADVAAVAASADGVVIGSAFERLIEEHLADPRIAELLAERVRLYKAATRPRA